MAVDVELGSRKAARALPSTHAHGPRTGRATSRSTAPLLAAFLVLLLVTGPAAGQPGMALEQPSYAEGDYWEYDVEARLDSLLGIENVTGTLVATGDARAQVTAVEQNLATLSWMGNLSLQGQFAFPGQSMEAGISGALSIAYEELRRAPYFLPIAFDAQALLDGAITFIVTVPYMTILDLGATVPPDLGSPTYPLGEENRTFPTTTTLTTNLSVDFLGMTIENSTLEEVASNIRWIVSPSSSVEVPAGTFSGLRISMEALAGFVPSPFQVLLPGAVQVTHHSGSVGNPVLYQFLANGTVVGSAALRTYSSASAAPPPFWLNPLFLGGLLAVPIGILLFRYWRERRRGL